MNEKIIWNVVFIWHNDLIVIKTGLGCKCNPGNRQFMLDLQQYIHK